MSETNDAPVVPVLAVVVPAPVASDRLAVIEARLAALELCNGIRPAEAT